MVRKKPKYKNVESLNPSKRAAAGVSKSIEAAETADEIVIRDEKIKEKAARREAAAEEKREQEAQKVSAEEALTEERITAQESNRENVRVLVLTRDNSMLVQGSVSQARLLEYSKMFAEVHVVVLCMSGESTNEPARIAQNVWVYPTNSSRWWRMVFDGYHTAEEQLAFGGGFRADVIIAEDPFESGVVAWRLGRKHSRHFQIHVFENYFDPQFERADAHNRLRLTVSGFIVPRATCVRTNTALLRDVVTQEYPKCSDVTETLPTYYNFDAWEQSSVTADLSDIYPQFKFTLLHFSSMTGRAHTTAVIDGLYYLLRQYPTIGLVVVGDGPNRKKLEEQVIRYELMDQIKFLDEDDPFVSYIKTANVLVHTSEDSEDDKFILCAAAVGTPMIAADHGLAEKLFTDGETAFLCPVDSPPCIGEKVNRFLNETTLRNTFKRYARETVHDRIEQDYGAYLRSYRDSIIRCIMERS